MALVGIIAGVFVLTGCELNNQEMDNIIQKCKDDVECKEILDREIDEALEERGLVGDHFEDDVELLFELDLTDEEIELLETLEALDNEVWDVLEAMTDEELEALMIQEFESMLGRELTAEEQAALEVVEALWMTDIESDVFQSEQEYLEMHLGRELTDEELAAVHIIEEFFTSTFDEEGELTPEVEAAFDLIDELYESAYEFNEIDELELMLGRQLTAEELAAFDIQNAINWEEDIELTQEQNDALDVIMNLYDEAFENVDEIEVDYYFDRELTEEEQAALDIVDALYEEMELNFEFEIDEYDFANEMITYYEAILNRPLTDLEIEAIEFSLEFYYFEDDFYFEDEYVYYEEEVME